MLPAPPPEIAAMPRQPESNPFMEFTPEELARACMEKAKAIQQRLQRTAAGDEIAYLLIACAWTLDPPESPDEGFSGRG